MTTTPTSPTRTGPWFTSAACSARLDLPWTRDLADVTPWDAATMQAVCDGCPVVLDCLAAVDRLDITGGWWAGHDRDPHAHTADHAPPPGPPPPPTRLRQGPRGSP